ncbi:MAG: serpin family protein, partial [Clostridiales bacterium]|nr:serpin family protein [Clostridiales bacterium]
AFTRIDYVGAAKPEGMAEMFLDRPFIFAIIKADGCPLFVGVINNPKAD